MQDHTKKAIPDRNGFHYLILLMKLILNNNLLTSGNIFEDSCGNGLWPLQGIVESTAPNQIGYNF